MDAHDRSEDEDRLKNTALNYAKKGLAVIPVWSACAGACTCGDPDCANVGKHPIEPLVPHGIKDASTDPEVIAEWWSRYPNANIGIRTGHPYVVIDIDPRHNGDKSIAEFQKRHHELPGTLCVNTGGGGEHRYYRTNGTTVRGRIAWLPGVDVKSDNGYVLGPPSNHKSGRTYEFQKGAPAPVILPSWLAEAINGTNGDRREPFDTAKAFSNPPQGERYKTLVSLAGKLRHSCIPEEHALFISRYACSTWTPAVEDEVIVKTVARVYGTYPEGPELPPHPADSEAPPLGEELPEAFTPPEHWRVLDGADIDRWDCKELEWIIEPILARDGFFWMCGPTQAGKTLMALYLSLIMLEGGKLFDRYQVNPVDKIVYVFLEDPPRRIKARIEDMLRGRRIAPGRFLLYYAPGFNLGDDLMFQWFDKMIATEKPDFTFLDTWQRATPGVSSFDDEKMTPIVHRMADLTRKYERAIGANDHFRKSMQSRRAIELEFDEQKGSGSKQQNADSVWIMDRKDGQVRVKVRCKDNGTGEEIGFLLDVAPEGEDVEKFKWAGDLEAGADHAKKVGDDNRDRVLQRVISGSGTADEIAHSVGLSLRTVQRHLKVLMDEGKVTAEGRAKLTRYATAESRQETDALSRSASVDGSDSNSRQVNSDSNWIAPNTREGEAITQEPLPLGE